ncbi:MAG TPA: alpha-amylase family glycosyl hydrolase, partial [Candidatus Saccharibacteria bacterium]|nr:alpha-amylase family glycosyl hydrolase [Candidatus Saccharibacteria bacterium]
ELPDYRFSRLEAGKWELRLPAEKLRHGLLYKLRIHWRGGSGDRLPSYTTYALQDPSSLVFNAAVWSPPTTYAWQSASPETTEIPLIYEAHIGMSSEKPEVATYAYFTKNILPRIKKAGYNTVQLMAIAEHPYYGSFGYHVTNFFAVSSRFGTPDDFKKLVDTAHSLGLRVIVDLVHSHAAKNELEGLSRFDGSLHQYFHKGPRGNHPAWDSRVFDYGKSEIAHFLLSNCRFWLDEYRVDGFRFDGITSMLYTDHGLERAFTSYDDYFGDDIDLDALTYLTLASELAHSIRPDAILIAEDMSGMPGLAAPVSEGGVGFDYRLNMGTPDLWIKTLKEQKDEDWDLGHLFHELTTKRPEEKTISYTESHDQALVGDKTLLFRLLDSAMYEHMTVNDSDVTTDRGIALIKLLRLLTAATQNGGYLNFMGNEFGHPEWIDFPREGNDWSYHYARRQWSLVDNPKLKYHQLAAFDEAMLDLIKQLQKQCDYVQVSNNDHTLSFMRGDYLFAFNFSPDTSFTDYAFPVKPGSYSLALTTDAPQFGGHDRIDTSVQYFTRTNTSNTSLLAYLPARSALVLKRQTD